MIAAGLVLLLALSHDTVPSIRVTTVPATPVRGQLAYVVVGALDSVRPYVSAHGELGHEPLHFVPTDRGGFMALAGIPIEGTAREPVRIWLTRGDGSADTMQVALPVRRGNYRAETLRVDPRLTRLDSADLARVERENARARAVAQASHQTPRLWHPDWQRPRPGRVTSVFGTRRLFNGVQRSRHLGTDFAGKIGAPITAPNRGVVALIDDFLLAGRVLYLDHGGGLITGFFHLSDVSVALGDTVDTGQLIGTVGQSGRVTGPHLHWIVRYGGVSVDPMSVFTVSGKR